MINFIKRVRERTNIFIYDSQHQVLSTLKYLTFITSVFSLAILVYYHGFPIQPQEKTLIVNIIKGLFLVYIINYLMRSFYAFENIDFIKKNWLEGSLILLLVIDIIGLYFFNYPLLERLSIQLGIKNFKSFYIIFIQLFIMLLMGIQLFGISSRLLEIQVKPAILLLSYFIVMISFGTILLMLPEMTVSNRGIQLMDVLFTSVSATCVTGLTVVDTATYFTYKGHIIILILIQMGALGIMIFASFFALFLKKGIGISKNTALLDYISENSQYNAFQMIKQIVVYTMIIEIIAASILFMLWDPVIQFESLGMKLFYSFFHAVSGFCNGGFTLFTEGLYNPLLRNAYVLHLVFIAMVFTGALGFPVWRDMFGVKNIKERMKLQWKRWKTSTTIGIYASSFLLAGGAIVFFILEKNNTLFETDVFGGVTSSILQVVSRTGGFTALNMADLSDPAIILLIFLMYIGGTSGSMTGGLKTSTFMVLLLSVISTLRGKKGIEFSRKSISNELLFRAFSIVMFSSVFILTAVFLLALTDPEISIIQLVFEEVSAFSLSGLSTGITSSLSLLGKVVIIISMYIGRIGTLTLAYLLGSPIIASLYKYPKTQIVVG